LSVVYGCMGAWVWVCGCMDVGCVGAYADSCLSCMGAASVYGCMGVWVCGCGSCMGVWVYGCMGVWVYGCMRVWVYGCTLAWVHSFLSCMGGISVYGCMGLRVYGYGWYIVLRVYGCMGVWVLGYMGVWVYGSTGVWVYGCMGLRVYGCVNACMVYMNQCCLKLDCGWSRPTALRPHAVVGAIAGRQPPLLTTRGLWVGTYKHHTHIHAYTHIHTNKHTYMHTYTRTTRGLWVGGTNAVPRFIARLPTTIGANEV